MSLLIANAEVDGQLVDVRVNDHHVVEIGASLPAAPHEERYDAHGGALLPGLHDHHVHLHAMAAAITSVRCGPPDVTSSGQLQAVLAKADGELAEGEWIRGVGYHESVAGMIGREELDRLAPDRPTRIQHRGGALWIVNTAGLRELERGGDLAPADGRLWRSDHLFHYDSDPPRLDAIGQRLLSLGITGVTDATPDLTTGAMQSLAAARHDGSLPQRLIALGAPNDWHDPVITAGPWKLLLHDHDLPTLDALVAMLRGARRVGRAVAVHCVTRTSLVLTLTAFDEVGSISGDRIEHAGVVPADLIDPIRRLGLRVVTQPSFVRDRGDEYLMTVDADDVDCLYPYASLLDAAVPVAASSDAPFGDIDPWQTIEAAVSRRTRGGAVLREAERVTPQAALDGYLSDPLLPGGKPRRIEVGGPTDLCLLAVRLAVALEKPDAGHVAMVIAGAARYDAMGSDA